MEIEIRLERLEEAHRALTAQHLALQAIVRTTLPLLPVAPATLERLILTTAQTSQHVMAEAGWDEEQIERVGEWIEILAGQGPEGVIPH